MKKNEVQRLTPTLVKMWTMKFTRKSKRRLDFIAFPSTLPPPKRNAVCQEKELKSTCLRHRQDEATYRTREGGSCHGEDARAIIENSPHLKETGVRGEECGKPQRVATASVALPTGTRGFPRCSPVCGPLSPSPLQECSMATLHPPIHPPFV